MSVPRVIIITEGDPVTGYGHVMRMCSLAGVMRPLFEPVFFITAGSHELIIDEGFRIRREGPEALSQIIEESFFKLAVIDLRRGDLIPPILDRLRGRSIPVIGVHDMGLNPFDSDVLIDGSVIAESITRWKEVPIKYLGPDYMILSARFSYESVRKRIYRERVKKLVLSVGGENLLPSVMEVARGLIEYFKDLDVIVPAGIEIERGGESCVSRNSRISIRKMKRSDFIDCLARSDMAITGGGITLYEALSCGLPVVALTRNRLQAITVKEFERRELCVNGGGLSTSSVEEVVKSVEKLLENREMRQNYGERGRKLVDGKGAYRVRRIMEDIHYGGIKGAAA